MERYALEELKKWKQSKERKPLFIQGARQVGKTWLMKEFGAREYEKVAYVNFESSTVLKSILINDFDINRILTAIRIETGVKITSENTLIIFDEIQEAERAITQLHFRGVQIFSNIGGEPLDAPKFMPLRAFPRREAASLVSWAAHPQVPATSLRYRQSR